MAIKLVSDVKHYIGLSKDCKPIDCGIGSRFYETDTLNVYVFDSSTWHLLSSETQALTLENVRLLEIKELLQLILLESQKGNIHLQLMTDEEV